MSVFDLVMDLFQMYMLPCVSRVKSAGWGFETCDYMISIFRYSYFDQKKKTLDILMFSHTHIDVLLFTHNQSLFTALHDSSPLLSFFKILKGVGEVRPSQPYGESSYILVPPLNLAGLKKNHSYQRFFFC